MKTTVEIADDLLERARKQARRTGRPMRALIEDGLRLALSAKRTPDRYRLNDLSVGDPRGHNPLETLSWQELRDAIYGGR